jgi:hypothetical protein
MCAIMLVFTVLSIPSYVFFYYGNQSSTGEDQENPKFVLSKLSLGNIGACKSFYQFLADNTCEAGKLGTAFKLACSFGTLS